MRLERSDLELEVVVRRIQGGELDLQPDFQRGDVWRRDKQRKLVDSILRSWYVPPIHIIREPETSAEMVLDGQQRLASIRDFLTDQLQVHGYFDPVEPSIQMLDGRVFSDLPIPVRKAVNRFPLTIVTLVDYDPAEPLELFYRLNEAVSLTPSEKRNALFGPVRDAVRELANELKERGLLQKEVVGFSNGRLGYDDVLAHALLALTQGSIRGPLDNRSLEFFYRSGEVDHPKLHRLRSSSVRFLEAIRLSELRMNKASLLSWLIAASSMSAGVGNDPVRESARVLCSPRRHRRAIVGEPQLFDSDEYPMDEEDGEWDPLEGALREMFLNRSSYRVSDVRSVLMRDVIVRLMLVLKGASADDVRVSANWVRAAKRSNGYGELRTIVDMYVDEYDGAV